jgi:integrase
MFTVSSLVVGYCTLLIAMLLTATATATSSASRAHVKKLSPPCVTTLPLDNLQIQQICAAFGDRWDRIVKRAKLRHRNAYQSRHTFACWSLSVVALLHLLQCK